MVLIPKLVGKPIRRREDPRMITGSGRYVDDIKLPEMAYLTILRSPYAHAIIRDIDTQRVREHANVLAVITGKEIAQRVAPLPTAPRLPEQKAPVHYPLAFERVRHVGEGVAAVVTTERYDGSDVIEMIGVDYDPLPVVVDLEQALKPTAPVLHEPGEDNVAFRSTVGDGDVEGAFQEADVVIRQRFINQRVAAIAMEPRGVLAQYEQGTGELTIWTSTQIPHIVRTRLATMLNFPENQLRVIAPEVGGGFGSKLDVYAEEALTALMALELERPVKWIETRRENFVATTHGRGHVQDVELAAKKDGTILGFRVRVLADMGGYFQLLTPGIPTAAIGMLPGVYNVPNIYGELIGVFTNKTPTDAYRGAGRPEATYLIERIVDMLAAELNLDPADVRRKNFIPQEAFPYLTATGNRYDSGNYAQTLDKALEIADYSRLRREQDKLRRQGRYLGIGLCTYVEICGAGPSKGESLGGWERGTVRIEPTGKVTILTGTSPHGQGGETTYAQIVADILTVPLEDIAVIHGDTATIRDGIGTFGSRTTSVGGSAVLMSAQKVRGKVLQIAGNLLEVAPEDLVLEGGEISVRGAPTRSIHIKDVVRVAYRPINLPREIEPGLEATSFFEPPDYTYPFGTHISVVEVDSETGQVSLRKYIAVDDCGRVINPMLVDGQIHGGIAQGIGQALYEEILYDEIGQIPSGTLVDYAVPRADRMISFETARTETPSPVNPLGAKGAGEAGTVAAPPAIVNAIIDALSPFGVKHIDMPVTSEKIWKAIHDVESTSGFKSDS